MDALHLEELSATTAQQANSLELLPGQEQFMNPVTYENADSSIEISKTWSRVIMQGTEVVGFVRAYFDAENPHDELRCCVWRVSVAGSAQGRGVGRFAIQAVKDEAIAQGFDTVSVVWQAGDKGPGEFFHRLGFVDTGITEYGETIGTLPLR
jgi:diamine N-acetyltransferase